MDSRGGASRKDAIEEDNVRNDAIEAIDIFAREANEPKETSSIDATENHPLILHTIVNNIKAALDPSTNIEARIETITSTLASQSTAFKLDIIKEEVAAESVNQIDFNAILEQLNEIQLYDVTRTRDIPITVSMLAGSALGLTFSSLLIKFLRLPEIVKTSGITYQNTVISSGGTCGTDFPLNDMCINLLNATIPYPAWFCGSVAGIMCANLAPYLNYTTVLQFGMTSNCLDTFHVSNFSNWQKIVGGAYQCYLKATDMCASGNDDVIKYAATLIKNGSRYFTCGALLPLEDLCDTSNYTSSASYQCAMQALDINQKFAPWAYQFKNAITAEGLSCSRLFPSFTFADACQWISIFGNGQTCASKAESECANPTEVHHYWWSKQRIGILVGSILALTLVLTLAFLAYRKFGPASTKYGRLPADLKAKISEANNESNFVHNEMDELPVVIHGIESKLYSTSVRNFLFSPKLEDRLFTMESGNDVAMPQLHNVTTHPDIGKMVQRYFDLNLLEKESGPDPAPANYRRNRCC